MEFVVKTKKRKKRKTHVEVELNSNILEFVCRWMISLMGLIMCFVSRN